jgi:hypothetical protein
MTSDRKRSRPSIILCAFSLALATAGCGGYTAHSQADRVAFLSKALKTENLPPQVRAQFQKEYEKDTNLPAPTPPATP